MGHTFDIEKELNSLADQHPIFHKVVEVGRMRNLSREEMYKYRAELKVYQDLYSQLSYAYENGVALGRKKAREMAIEKGREIGWKEGMEKGIEEGRAEVKAMMSKNLYAQGVALEVIASGVGLSVSEVKNIIGIE